MILTSLLLLSAQQVQLDEALDQSLQEMPPPQQLSFGAGARAGSACDDFNRADGPIGPDWTEMSGTHEVVSNECANISGGNAWMQHNSASKSYDQAVVAFDLAPNPSGASRYSAAISGIDSTGTHMLYTKIQNQSGRPGYGSYGIYEGFNGGGGPNGYGGFFSFGFQVDSVGDGAHVRVSVNASDQTVLEIDDDLDGAYEYSFDSGGTVSGMGITFGTGVGYGSWSSGVADNWELNDGCSGPSLTLSTSGSCPGAITFTVSGGSGSHALIYGPAGSYTKPSGACAGVTVDIDPPTLGAVMGNSLTANVPAGGCGLTVQVVDLNTCVASNSLVL